MQMTAAVVASWQTPDVVQHLALGSAVVQQRVRSVALLMPPIQLLVTSRVVTETALLARMRPEDAWEHMMAAASRLRFQEILRALPPATSSGAPARFLYGHCSIRFAHPLPVPSGGGGGGGREDADADEESLGGHRNGWIMDRFTGELLLIESHGLDDAKRLGTDGFYLRAFILL